KGLPKLSVFQAVGRQNAASDCAAYVEGGGKMEKKAAEENKMIPGALVLEGGSMRCLFTAGVLDVFLEKNMNFEYVIGVSAGSMTGMSYISRQPGRTKDVTLGFVKDSR